MKRNVVKIFAIIIILIAVSGTTCFAANKKIVLDPGHGGYDSGASNTAKGLVERDINLKIATYLKDYLSEYAGIDVVMTHNGFPSGTLDLKDRTTIAKDNNADLLLCLHCNSSVSGNITGAEAYVTANTCLPKYNAECTKIADLILNNLNKLGIQNRGTKIKYSGDSADIYSDGTRGDYYGIIRYAMNGVNDDSKNNIQAGEGVSTVLIEHCFVNGGDEKFLDSDEDIKKLAKADCDAIVAYYGLRLKNQYVSSVKINNNDIKIVKGKSEKLTATVLPDTAINKKVKWSSNNANVAKVDENGNVTAVGVGDAIITATTDEGGFTATCMVTVTGLELEKKEFYILEGEKFKIDYEPQDLQLEYQVENNDIISIDSENTVSGLKEGSTKVKVNVKGDKFLSEEITVNVYKLKDNQKLQLKNLNENNFKLTKIKEKTSLKDFQKNIDISDDFEIKIDNGNKEFITTNSIVSVIEKKSHKIVKQYTCFIYGDINEDGKITAADYVLIKNHIMETNRLKNSYLNVADVSRDNKVTTKDYILIKNHIMNGSELPVE